MIGSNSNNQELNPITLRKIESRIYAYEYENHSTKKLSDSEMIRKITKVIDELVRAEDDQ